MVNVAKLIYYTKCPDTDSMLRFLEALGVPTETHDEKAGFYFIEAKFGRTFEKILPTDATKVKSSDEALLILKPLSSVDVEKLNQLASTSPQLEIFVMAHKLFDLSKILDQIQATSFQTSRIKLLCCIKDSGGLVFSLREIKKLRMDFSVTDVIALSLKENRKPGQVPIKLSLPPFLIMFLMKFFLSPWLECKLAYRSLKLIQILWVKRLLELFDFIFYALLSIFYPTKYFLVLILPYPIYKVYWFCCYQYKTRIQKQIWTE